MNPLIAFNLALAIAEELLPAILEKIKAGEVSPAEQLDARTRYDRLRAQGPALFAASHWKPRAGTDERG